MAVAIAATLAPAEAIAASVPAAADAHVTAAKRTANFGKATTLVVDASPSAPAYLRFNVKAAGAIASASLQLYPRTGSQRGVSVHRGYAKAWGERTITYANRPGLPSTPVAASGRLRAGKRIAIDVSKLVTKSGVVTLRLTTKAKNGEIRLASREARRALRPRLVVNQAPVCDDVELEIGEDAAGEVAPNCSDADGDALAYQIAGEPAHGTAEITLDGKLRYEPDLDWNGVDGFTYTASDGTATSDPPVNVFVDVAPENDPPECFDLVLTVDEDDAIAEQVCTDVDGDPLEFTVTGGPQHGDVDMWDDGGFDYYPDPDYSGPDEFRVVATDDSLVGSGDPAVVELTVTPLPDAPVCDDVEIATNEDVSGEAAPNCSDPDDDPLTYQIVGAPSHGTAEVTTSGKLLYTPDPDWNGADGFTYTASDGTDASDPPVNVFVDVAPANDAPTCTAVAATTAEDTPVDVTPVCADVDGDALTYEVTAQGTKGSASPVDGVLRYEPNANENGTDAFTYRASDGTDTSAGATASVTIAAEPDAPSCDDMSLTMAEDATPVVATPDCSDPDGDALTYEIVTQGTKGVASVVSGELRYDSDPNANGADSFTYRASDGAFASAAATVAVAITPVNDRPVCSALSLTTPEDTPGEVAPLCVDADGDALTYLVVATTGTQAKGDASVTAAGLLRYVPDRDVSGSDSFSYRASDGALLSVTASVGVTITPVNDPPIANLDEFATVVAGDSVDVDAKKNDVEGPSDEVAPQSLTVTAASDPANGTASVEGGKVRYTPDAGSAGDAFEYTVCDNGTPTECATGTVSVMVVGSVSPTDETDPVAHSGDAADDVAIWPHPTDPAQSLVIGTDKLGGLMVYDLDGTQIALIDSTRKLNNVDLRTGFELPGMAEPVDLVAASDRTGGSWRINLYRVDPTARTLVFVRSVPLPFEPYGLCMYRNAGGQFSVFVTEEDSSSGHLEQWELAPDALASGGIAATRVRDFEVGSESEGCVADDELGHLYVGEEDAGLWKYGAEPHQGATRTSVDSTAFDTGHLREDVEGLTIAYGADGAGYLIASSQGNSSFAVYERGGSNGYVNSFRVDTTGDGAVDGVTVTDGIDVTTANLGPAFPNGAFIAQDNSNQTPAGTAYQNFKLVPFEDVLGAVAPPF